MRTLAPLLLALTTCATVPKDPHLVRTEEGLAVFWHVTVRVQVDPAADVLWHNEINGAMLAWNALIGRDMLVRTSSGAPDIFITLAPLNEGIAGRTGCFYESTGELSHAVVQLSITLYPTTAYRTVMHELGHALGLAHDDDDDESLMAPTASPGAWFVRPDDADYVRSLYH